MRALVTGERGFTGHYLLEELRKNGYEVFGMNDGLKDCDRVDICKFEDVKNVVLKIEPDVIFHLAGQSSPQKSWEIPQLTMMVNAVGTINILESVKLSRKKIKVLLVGSSDQYGTSTKINGYIDENTALEANNPYSVSKKSQEEIARIYTKFYNMDIYITRSFNHFGPRQKLGFIVPDFCKGIIDIENKQSSAINVGNLEVIRDFTDVRDVVRAYRMIIEYGKSGDVYNVGSGVGTSAKELLEKLIKLSKVDILVKVDESKFRLSDKPIVICDNTKLTRDTGWKPRMKIEETLEETLEYFRKKEVI